MVESFAHWIDKEIVTINLMPFEFENLCESVFICVCCRCNSQPKLSLWKR